MELTKRKIELQRYMESLFPIVKGYAPNFRTRCILCGDSKKDKRKMRLGIKIDVNNPTEPILYHCFNCGRSGILSNRMLKEISGAENLAKINLDIVNKKIMESSGNIRINKYKNTKTVKVKIPALRKEYIYKAKYLFDRLGTMIDPNDFEGIKIIWSLWDFLKLNNIKPKDQYTSTLDRDYIGFLSVNNDFIIFRDTTDKRKMRYVKYNIFGFFDNSTCFYSIPGKVDLLSTAPINFKVAEGPFDTLSILYNICGNNRTNSIYLASSNGEFYTSLLHYFQKGLVGDNINIDIYKDNDSIIDYNDLKKKLKTYVIDNSNITIYYNDNDDQKDFGVSPEEIQTEIFM